MKKISHDDHRHQSNSVENVYNIFFPIPRKGKAITSNSGESGCAHLAVCLTVLLVTERMRVIPLSLGSIVDNLMLHVTLLNKLLIPLLVDVRDTEYQYSYYVELVVHYGNKSGNDMEKKQVESQIRNVELKLEKGTKLNVQNVLQTDCESVEEKVKKKRLLHKKMISLTAFTF